MDLIETATLPLYTGFSSFNGNAATTQTRGVDLVLNTRNTKGKLLWQTNFLFTYLKDVVTSFDTKYNATSLVNNSGSLVAVVGRPLFGIYAYKWAGLDPMNGDPTGYINGQKSKNYLSMVNAPADSLAFKGAARPTIFGSIRNTISYKRFSLSVNIVYKLGYVYRKSSTSINYQEVIGSYENSDYSLRWQKPGDELTTTVPSMVYPLNASRNNFYKYSEVLVEKADHIRLQDIRLDYNIDKQVWKKLPMDNLQLYIYANNLGILWKANKSGIDPDYNDNFYSTQIKAPVTVSIGLKTSF